MSMMSQGEFERWFGKSGRAILLRTPSLLAPCACGDVNCHGWRFLPSLKQTPGNRSWELWTRRN